MDTNKFPFTFNDFLYLGREIKKEELHHCDKEGVIDLCVALKSKALKLEIGINEAHYLLDECFEFISKGANVHTMQERILLEDKIKTYFNK